MMPAAESPTRSVHSPQDDQLRILALDSDELGATKLSQILRDLGHACVTASTIEQARNDVEDAEHAVRRIGS
jgi:hypothetical protein